MPGYVFLLAMGAFITLGFLLSSPSDPKSAVLFGYSLERIFLAGGVLIAGVTLLILTWSWSRHPELSERLWEFFFKRKRSSDIFLALTGAGVLLFWILIFLPSYRLGSFSAYIPRLYPIIIWLAVAFFVTLIILFFERRKISFSDAVLPTRAVLWVGLLMLGILILLAVLVVFSGLGLSHPEEYWYGAGVPVLGLQILTVAVVGWFSAWFEFGVGGRHPRRVDALVCVTIFILAAILWGREPLRPNYFMPDTAKNEMYPYSDSATFDVGSQYALIGQGLFNGEYFDRSLYSSFLTYLHMAVGDDLHLLLTIQAVLFAIFPVIIYLIGRELHGRTLGIVAALLIILRGLNSILAAEWIDLAGPKMMLTDFPTLIGISLFLLFILYWVRQPFKLQHAVLAGGMIGLTIMLRTHVLLLVPAVIAFVVVFGMQIRWSYRLAGSMALIVGMLAATSPWDVRNTANGYPMFYVYYSRIATILEERYEQREDSFQPPLASNAVQAIRSMNEAAHRQRIVLQQDDPFCRSSVCKIANHFLHNLVTSMIYLPTSLVFDDLWNVTKLGTPYWQAEWQGDGFGLKEGSLLFINMAFISLGIGAAWERKRWIGLLPIVIFAVYLLSNSLAFTSGGRYIAPVDWVICIYFMLGIIQVFSWIQRWIGFIPVNETRISESDYDTQPKMSSAVWKNLFPALLLILAIGSLIPLSEMFFKPRYEVQSPDALLAELEESGLLERSGYSRADLTEFLSQPGALISAGRALYPRYYRVGEGEPDRSTYYRYLDFRRLVFTLIGPYSKGAQGILIPGEPPEISLHAEDVVVLGCWNTTYYAPFLDAVVVFVTSDDGYVYTRAPEAPLQCPLPEPKP